MPDIEFIEGEIERMRSQVLRQRNEITQLQRAGISTRPFAQIAAPVGCVGSGSRRVNLPSVNVATVPQRAMQRPQYPCTRRTFGVSADMHEFPRGCVCRIAPSCRLPLSCRIVS